MLRALQSLLASTIELLRENAPEEVVSILETGLKASHTGVAGRATIVACAAELDAINAGMDEDAEPPLADPTDEGGLGPTVPDPGEDEVPEANDSPEPA